MAGSATSIFLHFYTGGVAHRSHGWEIGAPFKSQFPAPFYCPSVGFPSAMADLVAGVSLLLLRFRWLAGSACPVLEEAG